jgi:hypothetical protein
MIALEMRFLLPLRTRILTDWRLENAASVVGERDFCFGCWDEIESVIQSSEVLRPNHSEAF